MNYTKRNIIKIFCTAIPLILIRRAFADGNPYRDRFQSYRQTFRIEPNKEETERIIKNIIRERTVSEGLVLLDVPDTAEDGNVVPVHFKINCSMKGHDFPKKVHVLGLENPFPEIAVYEFFPEVGKAEVSFRCRMRKSSYLMIIAEMSDGRIGLKKNMSM